MEPKDILTWAILGLVAGAIAKIIYPSEASGGILATMGLGIAGSVVGGFIGQELLNLGSVGTLDIPGILTAVGGALVLIFLWSKIRG